MILPFLLVASFAITSSESSPQPSVEPNTENITESNVAIRNDTSDLAVEGQDQVAILKQINRVNEDGSYTFGYEAADGSFKIETRDVAGNVKGMFGFVDEGGELRRVSYSASNGTGFQSTGAPNVPPIVTPADVETSTRINIFQSSTTHNPLLPVYIYGSSTTTARTTPEVIQHIPKLRPTPASYSTEPTESEEITTEKKRVNGFLLPKKSSTPNYITLSTTTPALEEVEPTLRPSVVQLTRPRLYKKIVVTKRPVDPSTTPASPITTTYYPVQETSVEDTPNAYQRDVDSNSLGENGLTASGTEDSPDVYGGSTTGRPFPGGVYRNFFPQVPQYQRILQSAAYLQNQNPYQPTSPIDPRLQQPHMGPLNPYGNAGIGQLNPDLRYQDPSGRGLGYPNPGNQVPFSLPPGPNQYNRGNYVSNQAPLPFPQNDPQGFRLGIQPQPYEQPNSPQYPQGPLPVSSLGQSGIPPHPQPQPQLVPQNIPPNLRQRGQTLPIPTPIPSQGLTPLNNPVDAKINELSKRPQIPLSPQTPEFAYANGDPYGQQPQNPQIYFMEQILRMLIAAQAARQAQQPPPPPPQQLSPFQQALLSVLGPNNVPQGIFGQSYDPRYYGQNQAAYNQRPQYDPRSFGNPYSGYQDYPDPYSQYRSPPYGPQYQGGPYYPGYSPNPYYQGTPEQALLRMFLGSARYPTPLPQMPNPQIQQSPQAFDGRPPPGEVQQFIHRQPQEHFIPRQQFEPDIPNPVSPEFGRRIPLSSNIVQRSPVYSKVGTAAARSHGSRNVQILDEGSTRSETTPTTTSKPR